MGDQLRLADLLTALSVATDLGIGYEPEKAIRSCVLATELARASGTPERQVADIYFASLLFHLGCTASSHELAYVFGDDVGVLPTAEHTDDTTLRGSLELLALVGRGTGARRPAHLARMLRAGSSGAAATIRSTCEVGTRLAARLHLGDEVTAALNDTTQTWDGRSGAWNRSGEDIALPARYALLATQAISFTHLGGPELAVEVARDRAGRWFDPELAACFERIGPDVLRRLEEVDVWEEVLTVEPSPVRRIPDHQVDEVVRVFADMVDLKSTFTLGHSSEVAHLAVAAAGGLGLGEEVLSRVARAGMLHDLGRVAVSAGIWEKAGPLTASQREQVRLHPYWTERILGHSEVLAPLARIAGMHHERQDGSGYHHGADAASIPMEAQLLAAADVYQAMTQRRAHRPALAPDQAAAQLLTEAEAGHLDVPCARAVAEAAGHTPGPRRRSWPGGLSDREVDVLRLLARGATNRAIAQELVISRRTAEHHVQHIYTKIGCSTRAAAAVFAMEHGLVR